MDANGNMSDREADALAGIIVGLAEIEQPAAKLSAALGPSGYASRDQLALTELLTMVGYLATASFASTAAADVPDPDMYPELSCDGLMAWLTDLGAHMRAEGLSLAEVCLRLQVESRRQCEGQAVAGG